MAKAKKPTKPEKTENKAKSANSRLLTLKKRELLENYPKKADAILDDNQRSVRRFIYRDMADMMEYLKVLRDSPLNNGDFGAGAPCRTFKDLWSQLVSVVLQKPANWVRDFDFAHLLEKNRATYMSDKEWEKYQKDHSWEFRNSAVHNLKSKFESESEGKRSRGAFVIR